MTRVLNKKNYGSTLTPEVVEELAVDSKLRLRRLVVALHVDNLLMLYQPHIGIKHVQLFGCVAYSSYAHATQQLLPFLHHQNQKLYRDSQLTKTAQDLKQNSKDPRDRNIEGAGTTVLPMAALSRDYVKVLTSLALECGTSTNNRGTAVSSVQSKRRMHIQDLKDSLFSGVCKFFEFGSSPSNYLPENVRLNSSNSKPNSNGNDNDGDNDENSRGSDSRGKRKGASGGSQRLKSGFADLVQRGINCIAGVYGNLHTVVPTLTPPITLLVSHGLHALPWENLVDSTEVLLRGLTISSMLAQMHSPNHITGPDRGFRPVFVGTAMGLSGVSVKLKADIQDRDLHRREIGVLHALDALLNTEKCNKATLYDRCIVSPSIDVHNTRVPQEIIDKYRAVIRTCWRSDWPCFLRLVPLGRIAILLRSKSLRQVSFVDVSRLCLEGNHPSDFIKAIQNLPESVTAGEQEGKSIQNMGQNMNSNNSNNSNGNSNNSNGNGNGRNDSLLMSQRMNQQSQQQGNSNNNNQMSLSFGNDNRNQNQNNMTSDSRNFMQSNNNNGNMNMNGNMNGDGPGLFGSGGYNSNSNSNSQSHSLQQSAFGQIQQSQLGSGSGSDNYGNNGNNGNQFQLGDINDLHSDFYPQQGGGHGYGIDIDMDPHKGLRNHLSSSGNHNNSGQEHGQEHGGIGIGILESLSLNLNNQGQNQGQTQTHGQKPRLTISGGSVSSGSVASSAADSDKEEFFVIIMTFNDLIEMTPAVTRVLAQRSKRKTVVIFAPNFCLDDVVKEVVRSLETWCYAPGIGAQGSSRSVNVQVAGSGSASGGGDNRDNGVSQGQGQGGSGFYQNSSNSASQSYQSRDGNINGNSNGNYPGQGQGQGLNSQNSYNNNNINNNNNTNNNNNNNNRRQGQRPGSELGMSGMSGISDYFDLDTNQRNGNTGGGMLNQFDHSHGISGFDDRDKGYNNTQDNNNNNNNNQGRGGQGQGQELMGGRYRSGIGNRDGGQYSLSPSQPNQWDVSGREFHPSNSGGRDMGDDRDRDRDPYSVSGRSGNNNNQGSDMHNDSRSSDVTARSADSKSSPYAYHVIMDAVIRMQTTHCTSISVFM